MRNSRAGALCTLGLLGLMPARLAAQRPVFEAAYGAWWANDDTTSRVFHAGVTNRLLGPLGWGVGFVHLQDSRDSLRRTLSGAEVSLSLFRDGAGPYALAAAGLGVRHEGGGTDAMWSMGAGYAFRLLRSVSLGVEARYRVEDTRVRGFWRLDPADRRGLQLQGRLSFGIGGARAPAATPSAAAPPTGPAPAPVLVGEPASSSPDAPPDPYHDALGAGASEEAARIMASVVETALGAMGTPYRWGGSDTNGFDCSGLIQYAFAQHGIVLPRTSRDQARLGNAVDRRVEALRPGDVLAFSETGTSAVTHVGLYVGDGEFIHSATGGVKLSSLRSGDGDARWWRDRWIGARRIVE